MIDGSTVSASRTGPAQGVGNGYVEAEIDIDVSGEVLLDNGSVLQTTVFANGAVGTEPDGIYVKSDQLEIGNGSSIQSAVSAESTGGRGGDIELETTSLLLRDSGSQVMTSVGGAADGGNIILNVSEDLTVSGASLLQTVASSGSGNAGDIKAHAGNVEITQTLPPLNGLLSVTTGTSNTGNIYIEATGVQMLGGLIATVTQGAGMAGAVDLNVEGDISIVGTDLGGNVVANTRGSGVGGNVLVRAHNLLMTNDSQIQSATGVSGNAGTVNISLSGNLDVQDRSSIDSFTTSDGAAGKVIIRAKDIFIRGIADATDPESLAFSGEFTGISAFTSGAGQGGSIDIIAENLNVTDKGFIATNTTSGADAGITTIRLTGNLTLHNGAQVRAFTRGPGEAGDITIVANTVLLSGVNPVPFIGADGIERSAPSQITSSSEGAAVGGTINVTADEVALSNGASVVATSSFTGNAGNVDIKAKTFKSDNSTVTTAAEVADGGNINLIIDSLANLIESDITTSVQGGEGGDIDIKADLVVLDDSNILAQAGVGEGGGINIEARDGLFVFRRLIIGAREEPNSTDKPSVIDASAEEGINGEVNVQTPVVNLVGSLIPLPEAPLRADDLLRDRCAARIQEGQSSSLVVGVRDGVPAEPGNVQPSVLQEKSLKIATKGKKGQDMTASRHDSLSSAYKIRGFPQTTLVLDCSKWLHEHKGKLQKSN
jgi:hypothetical protein